MRSDSIWCPYLILLHRSIFARPPLCLALSLPLSLLGSPNHDKFIFISLPAPAGGAAPLHSPSRAAISKYLLVNKKHQC